MDFGIMFFSSSGAGEQANKYDLLMDTASFADRNGFSSVRKGRSHASHVCRARDGGS